MIFQLIIMVDKWWTKGILFKKKRKSVFILTKK